MIYVLSGGQTGAILTVTSSGAGTITVSNTSLGKSYSKSVTAGGSAVFKGLQTGTWTIKLTDGSKTSTKNITITSDYSTNIAYFSATISITYPAKSTCVVKNSSGTTVASNTNTGSSTKTWTATVNATGTYTVTATATDGSGKMKSATVSITADGQSASVTLTYELYLFSGSETWTLKQRLKGYGAVTTSNNTLTLTGKIPSGGSASLYACSAFYPSKVAKGEYSTLKATISSVTEPTNVYLIVQDDTTANPSGENYIAYVRITEAGTFTLPYPDGSHYVGLSVGGTSKVVASKVWLE